MATSNVEMQAMTEDLGANTTETKDTANSSANITAERIVYRTYGTLDNEGKITGVGGAKAVAVQRETSDHKNWDSLEAKGGQVLAENTYTFYAVNNEQGFLDLVPDSEQRVYIIQKGLDAIQNAAVASKQKETDETEKTFTYNGQVLDLKEDINTPPQRRSLSDDQKLAKMLSTVGYDKAVEMLQRMLATQQGQGQGQVS